MARLEPQLTDPLFEQIKELPLVEKIRMLADSGMGRAEIERAVNFWDWRRHAENGKELNEIYDILGYSKAERENQSAASRRSYELWASIHDAPAEKAVKTAQDSAPVAQAGEIEAEVEPDPLPMFEMPSVATQEPVARPPKPRRPPSNMPPVDLDDVVASVPRFAQVPTVQNSANVIRPTLPGLPDATDPVVKGEQPSSLNYSTDIEMPQQDIEVRVGGRTQVARDVSLMGVKQPEPAAAPRGKDPYAYGAPKKQSPLGIRPTSAYDLGDDGVGWNQAIRDAFMLDTSVGQMTMMAAVSKAYGVPIHELSRRVVPGYSAYDEDLSGYERWLDEFAESTSPEETAMIKQMIEENMDLRTNLEDYAGIRLAAGFLDPINLLPVPFALGKGFTQGAVRAMAGGGAIVAGTEALRHSIDPTSTWEETAFATLGGTMFMGLIGGAVGALPKPQLTTVDELVRRMTPPPGQTGMSLGFPWFRGGDSSATGIFRRVHQALKSTATDGIPLSRGVDAEKIKVVDDAPSAPKRRTHKKPEIVVSPDGEHSFAVLEDGINTVEVEPIGRNAGDATGVDTPSKVEVLKNPTQKELERWAGRDVKDARFIVDDDGNLYVWNGDQALHYQIKNAANIGSHSNVFTDLVAPPKELLSWLRNAKKTGVFDGSKLPKGTVFPKNIDAKPSGKRFELHYDGELGLIAIIRDGVLQIKRVLAPAGRGVDIALVQRAVKYAEDNGLRVVSDTTVSPAGQKRYAALEDEGFNVRKAPDDAVTKDSDGTLHSDEPVYEILPIVDPDAKQIPIEVRQELAAINREGEALAQQSADLADEIAEVNAKLKKAKAGWKTRRKSELKALLEKKAEVDERLKLNRAGYEDLNTKAAMMLDEKTIADWDLLPTGYNKILGKMNQMPWWRLMKTPLRELAPDLAVKYQLFALRMASTPGLNNIGNRVGATAGRNVEAAAIVYNGQWLAAAQRAGRIYRKWLGYGESSGQAKHFFIDSSQRVRSSVNKILGGEPIRTTTDGKLTIQEFETQISIALANGGKHEIPEVAEAAAGYMDALRVMGKDARELGIMATQRNIGKNIEWINDRIAEFDKKWAGKFDVEGLGESGRDALPPGLQSARDNMLLYRADLENRLRLYTESESDAYIHRLWIAEEVEAKADAVKAMIRQSFLDNPMEGKVPLELPDGRIRFVDAMDPDAIEARVNEAYHSILKEAEHGNFAVPKDERLRLRLAALESGESGVPDRVAMLEIGLIKRKLEAMAAGKPDGLASGPMIGRELDLDDAELIRLGVIEGNINNIMQHYTSRLAPMIETARIFGDSKALKHINDLHDELFVRSLDEPDPKKRAALEKEANELREAMENLRDVVHGTYAIPDNPSALTPRVLSALRNFNIIGAMGRSVFMAFGDVGNVVMSQGFMRSMGYALEHFYSGIRDGNIKMVREEVELAGSVSEVILGMRFHQLTDAGAPLGRATKFERGLAGASQRFFLLNLLGPWTDMMRKFSGGMMQSRIVENAVKWRAGTLSADEQTIMARLGINKAAATQIANEWERAGSLKHKTMYIANTEGWTSREARRLFRSALNTEINRMVPTPGAVDKPLALLKSDWWKVLFQYRGFSMAATHRIMGAGIHTKGAQKFSGFASMIGISMMVDAMKRPDYINIPMEEAVLRAVELSGVTGIILDLNDTLERATAGSAGVRPMLGMKIRERSPNWANRLGTLGAVPNQWLTLMYGLTSDDATTNDTARAIRYMIPYNNLLYWNEVFNRAQRASVRFIEESE